MVLASKPPSSLVLNGGGISVRVNGTAVDTRPPPVQDGAQATAWTNGAQGNGGGACSSTVDINSPSPKVVHVIRVNPDSTQIRISTGDAVVVDPGDKHRLVNGDDKSSSGASSFQGSECQGFESDPEGDDENDSELSFRRRPSASFRIETEPVAQTGVQLKICSYSDGRDDEARQSAACNADDEWDMPFHLRELDNVPSNGIHDPEDVKSKIEAAHAMLSGDDGNPRKLNRVRNSIACLLGSANNSKRNYDTEETGRVVFYSTSMGIVRTTFERCRKVKKILETLLIRFEERDVFMNRDFQQELRERLGMTTIFLPQVFIEGRHLGNAEVIEQLNEIGHLRDLLRPYKRQSVGNVCQMCGGYRFLMCNVCAGSKKSTMHRHQFTELVPLRCVQCNESGLVRCPGCITGEG